MGLTGGLGVFAGAAAIGLLHGAEPGHGWPIAATYALDRTHTWTSGLLASTLLGMGHLVSSLAVVAVFFLAAEYFDLTQIGWMRYVAGVLLIGLGIREYRRGGHSHGDGGRGHDHGGHEHDHGGHEHDHGHGDGDHLHSHDGETHDHAGHDRAGLDETDGADLAGLVTTAFVLGFVHEEEFEIIGLCAGSGRCLELMVVYALAVLASLVGLTMLLVAGYTRYQERVEEYTEYFPVLSAAVLILMGLGFIVGVI